MTHLPLLPRVVSDLDELLYLGDGGAGEVLHGDHRVLQAGMLDYFFVLDLYKGKYQRDLVHFKVFKYLHELTRTRARWMVAYLG